MYHQPDGVKVRPLWQYSRISFLEHTITYTMNILVPGYRTLDDLQYGGISFGV